MTDPLPDYVQAPFFQELHNRPAGSSGLVGLSQDEAETMRGKLTESLLGVVVQALTGGFLPGGLGAAFEQLAEWADTLLGVFDNIPIIGDLIDLLMDFLGGGDGETDNPALGGLAALLGNIPLIGPILQFVMNLIPGFSGNPLEAFMGIFNRLLGVLGLGSGSNLGGLGPINIPIISQIPIFGGFISMIAGWVLRMIPGWQGNDFIGGFLNILANFRNMFGGLFGLGSLNPQNVKGSRVITMKTQLPPHLLAGVAPGAANLLPDGNFSYADTSLAGNGQWYFDVPGKGAEGGPGYGNFCVRTKRNAGVLTVFWMMGTYEQAIGAGVSPAMLHNPRDWLEGVNMAVGPGYDPMFVDFPADYSRIEVISVTYPGAMFPMEDSVNVGVEHLIEMINQTPGKFILMGVSQGALVISNVYDQIRNGVLQHRNDDLVMGWAADNLRREKNRSFPGAPGWHNEGYGIMTPLQNTEDRWWEWSLTAGTYPAYDDPEGITWAKSDPMGSLVEGFNEDIVRQLWPKAMKMKNMMDAFTGFFLNLSQVQIVLGAMTPGVTPHGTAYYTVQPFLGDEAPDGGADDRTYWQYTWDVINSIAAELIPEPITIGEEHELEGPPFAVLPRQQWVAQANMQWMNIPEGIDNAFGVGINVYDTDGQFMERLTSEFTDVEFPDPSRTWGSVPLSGSFVMPEGAASARYCLWASAEAMTTGIIWFDEANLRTGQILDAALMGNIENISALLLSSVDGPQGMTDMASAMDRLIDGLGSAFTVGSTTVSGVSFAELFDLVQQTAQAANAGQSLGIDLEERMRFVEDYLELAGHPEYHVPEYQLYKEAGEFIYNIPTWAQSAGVLIDIVLCGGGGGGGAASNYRNGFGGDCAAFVGNTYVYGGSAIPLGTTQLKFIIGAGGEGGVQTTGQSGEPGEVGEPTDVRKMDNTLILTSVGGQFGGAGITMNPLSGNATSRGKGAADFNYATQTYFGGGDVNPSAWHTTPQETPGSWPGGGGGANPHGGPGAGPGAAGFAGITVRTP
jgi:hypothetical protein